MVGFAASDGVPVPVAGHRHRVDGIDLAAGGPQARDQQAAGRLDGHRDRVPGGVAVLGEQAEQLGQPGRVVADPAAGQQLPVPVHDCDVVVILGPVDPAVHVHAFLRSPREILAVCAGPSRAGHARSLMEGLKGTAIRSAVRNPSCPQAPVLPGARRHPAMVRGYSCGWLRPRPPIPARTVTSGEPARRVAYGPVTTGWCRDPDLIAEVMPPGLRNGFPAPASPARPRRSLQGPSSRAPGRHRSGRQAPPSPARAQDS